ncbi:MAG: hypothetical protein MR292_09250 [Alistipes sp.]|nr:hypothetical protein [Alistipes sp.]
MSVRTKQWRGVSRRSDRARTVGERDMDSRRSGCRGDIRDGESAAAGMSAAEGCDISEALLRACFVTGAVAEEYAAVTLSDADGRVVGIGWLVEFSQRPENVSRFVSEARAALRGADGCGRRERNVLREMPAGALRQMFGEMGIAPVPHRLITDRATVEELLYRADAADLVAMR